MKKNRLLISSVLLLSACSTPTEKEIKNEIKPERNTASVKSEGKYFKDITEESGVPNVKGSSVIIGDFNNDAWPDAIVGNRLLQNISNKDQIRFKDVTDSVGLSGLKGAPIWIDYNNDGQMDIMTTAGQIFENHKGKFTEVSKARNFNLPTGVNSISFADINADGFADIVVGMQENHTNNSFSFLPPHIYINLAGKSFLEVSNANQMSKYAGYTRSEVWADFRNNGTKSVYFSNYRLHENYLFDVARGKFTDISDKYNVKGTYNPKMYFDKTQNASYGPKYGHTIGAVWADFNNDGNFDLWTNNLVHKYVGPSNGGGYDIRGYVCDDSKIFKNSGAPDFKMTDVRSTIGIPYKAMGGWDVYKGDELWSHGTAADFDNDGLIDMYITQVYNLKYSYSLLVKNLGNFKFKDIGASEPTRVFDTYAAAWADFNNDGKMDLMVSGREGVDIEARVRVFENINEEKNNFVKIRLIGKQSGKNPVTTQVRVFHDHGVLLRQYEGVTGTMSQQNDPTIHFGLGKINKINKIEVRWSSGNKLTLNDAKPNKTYIATEQK